ncbi:hypothetical protein SAMN05216251_12754 [Actinacidiphila alni]|uniref:Uncharacterized protein n=1 Tax=Actinacidiphila alni TaxID=380248 RepID=A0A1I2L9S5_9ACTN|nr:hypothetical protein [Actinacidiphila alni]SFF75209.1 hypothetical protein SAMN05216251_12754 [Actinacidiphila alni]
MTAAPTGPNRSGIPYITLRDGERDVSDRDLALRPGPRGLRLAYDDETDADRGLHGVLLTRDTQNRGPDGWPTGKPQWKHNHAARQRQCMRELLCHYCTGQPSRTERGTLFLDVAGPASRAKPRWPEGTITSQPPLCLEHAAEAADRCRHGARHGGFTALRALEARPFGVHGTVYQVTGLLGVTAVDLPKPLQHVPVPYTRQARFMTLAAQYAVQLHGVTEVDLNHELAALDPTPAPTAGAGHRRAR